MDKAGVIFFAIVADTSKALDDCHSAFGFGADRHANPSTLFDAERSKFNAGVRKANRCECNRPESGRKEMASHHAHPKS